MRGEIREDGVVINVKEIDDWRVKDSKARSVIRSTLDDTTFDQVCDCEKHEQKDVSRHYEKEQSVFRAEDVKRLIGIAT